MHYTKYTHFQFLPTLCIQCAILIYTMYMFKFTSVYLLASCSTQRTEMHYIQYIYYSIYTQIIYFTYTHNHSCQRTARVCARECIIYNIYIFQCFNTSTCTHIIWNMHNYASSYMSVRCSSLRTRMHRTQYMHTQTLAHAIYNVYIVYIYTSVYLSASCSSLRKRMHSIQYIHTFQDVNISYRTCAFTYTHI